MERALSERREACAQETLYTLAMGWVQRKLAQATPPDTEDARELVDFALAGLRRKRSAA